MDKKYVYLDKVAANLEKYDAKLVELKGKVDEVQADVKVEYSKQVENLEKKRAEFAEKYGHLKETSEHAWEDVKAGTEKAWNELEESIEKAVARFK